MKKRLLYIPLDVTPFTLKDTEFLSKNYDIVTFHQVWSNKKRIVINLLIQLYRLVLFVSGSKAIIVMFGGYWSLLPAIIGKLFNKPVFIILGGADCVSFPEYSYGSLGKPIPKKIIYWSYKLAIRLLPVDESLVLTDYNYDTSVKEKKQGYLHFFPKLKTPHTVINNGFNANYWYIPFVQKDQFLFTTIARVTDESRYKIKGIDLVIRLAEIFPNYRFNVIGMDLIYLKSLGILPINKRFLNESRYYMQLSISEGFPNALCEAMLCECIPVCSAVGGMPFIVQDSGLLIEKKNFDLMVTQISGLISKSPEELHALGVKARKNIASRFPIEKRENAFLDLIEQY